MISWIGATFIVVCFLILMRLFRMMENSHDVVTIARKSLTVIKSPDLSDEEKETTLQKDAKQLLRLFLLLACSGVAAFLFPVGLLWIGAEGGWLSLESVFATAVSPLFLSISTLVTVLVLWNPLQKSSGEKSAYSFLERCVHKVAFSTHGSQITLADLEDRIYAKQLRAHTARRPVFITALPRAGTTLLLECFSGLDEFASHCYRDMPFILIPCFWSRFSKIFQQTGTLKERAHGDGMLIDFDSPEALEEVIWKAFYRKHYQSDRIIPWQEIEDEEFGDFFKNHMNKIILLRGGGRVSTNRYISKNNLNIARVQVLRQIIPDSIIIVPFRQPLQHAASLLTQHRNFMKIHAEDPFARDYMRDIGHFDFGENLCPVNFDGWLDQQRSQDPEKLTFWLEYWCATYKYLLRETNNIIFISYEELCENPTSCLKSLAQAVGCKNMNDLLKRADTIHPPRARQIETKIIDQTLLEETEKIYSILLESAHAFQIHHA